MKKKTIITSVALSLAIVSGCLVARSILKKKKQCNEEE